MIGMLLNYLEFSKFLVIFIIMLIVLIVSILLYLNTSLISGELPLNKSNISNAPNPCISIPIKENNKNLKLKYENKKIIIQGFHQNEILETQKKFNLGKITENVDHLTKKLTHFKNNIMDKKDEISIMFVESLSSLNSWKNNEVEREIFKEIHWNLEKNERENEDEALVYQYIFPSSISSHYSANLNLDREDGEEKEEETFSIYRLGICRIFEEDQNHLKSNIVKEVNGDLFKIYSEGNPYLIREKCRKETIPGNFDDTLRNYKEKGYSIIGLAGKKMKMNYLQSQRIERTNCESNMIFLGFAIYKFDYGSYKFAYS